MNKTIKIIIGIILVLIIIGTLYMLFFKTNAVFSKTTQLFYPDGCIEKYKNGVAITPLCSRGRMIKVQGALNATGLTT